MTAVEPQTVHLLAELEKVGGVIDRGLSLPPGLPYDQYENLCMWARSLDDMVNWIVGDLLNYGEDEYPDDIYVQAALLFGKSERTLINVKSVAKRVPPQRRRLAVKWSTHSEVASLDASEQRRILRQAEMEGLSKMQVRDLVKEAQGETNHGAEVVRDVCGECGRPLP